MEPEMFHGFGVPSFGVLESYGGLRSPKGDD